MKFKLEEATRAIRMETGKSETLNPHTEWMLILPRSDFGMAEVVNQAGEIYLMSHDVRASVVPE